MDIHTLELLDRLLVPHVGKRIALYEDENKAISRAGLLFRITASREVNMWHLGITLKTNDERDPHYPISPRDLLAYQRETGSLILEFDEDKKLTIYFTTPAVIPISSNDDTT